MTDTFDTSIIATEAGALAVGTRVEIEWEDVKDHPRWEAGVIVEVQRELDAG